MAAAFQESSPGWLWEKTQQRSVETLSDWFQRIDWPEPPELPDWPWPQWLADFFSGVASLFSSVFRLLYGWPGIGLLVLGGVGLSYGLYRLLRPYVRRDRWGRPGIGRSLDPSTLPGSIDHWLDEAQRHRNSQRYAEACRAIYWAMLLKFDETRAIPQEASRTDREYLHLSRAFPPVEASQLLLETHERLYFSSLPASEALFQRCWLAFQRLSLQLDRLNVQSSSGLRVGPDSGQQAVDRGVRS